MPKIRKDITGQKFGRLTVLKFSKWTLFPCGQYHQVWKCVCKCGTVVDRRSSDIKSGRTKSCGCYNRENSRKIHTTHGASKHPLYKIWKAMRQRCRNPKCKDYPGYGGRGIMVCKRWDRFEIFQDDMRKGYKHGLSIDRKNNDGPYSVKNCRWATGTEQANNKKRK